MKRFNYTGRKKILSEDVSVHLHDGTGENIPIIDVSVNLKDYELPDNSEVYLEVQRLTRFMRIHLSNMTDIIQKNNLLLDEFHDAEGIKFRIIVVDIESGKLLATAERVKFYEKNEQLNNNQKSILLVRSTDLSNTGLLWRIDYDDEDAILKIEKDLGNREQVVRSQTFKGFVLPSAMRQILSKIITEDWDEELSEPQELSTKWLLFVKQMGLRLPQKNLEFHEYEEWLDYVTRSLAHKIDVREQVIEGFESGAWQ